MKFLYEILIHLLRFLFFWFSPISQRVRFEKKNQKEKGAESFKKQGAMADLAFEFSSEGEYQQVASLIDDALSMNKRVELIFFSPSVEKTVLELYQRYPNNIRYLRYPLATLGFRSWITARTLILVRYDLFPEFLFWATERDHALKIVWLSFKKERAKDKEVSYLKVQFLKKATTIVYATEVDKNVGQRLGVNGVVYDFRMEQIHRRIQNRDLKFQKLFPLYPEIKKIMEKTPREKRLIMGNAWPVDLELLKDLPFDIQVVIVPHQLSPEIIEKFKSGLKEIGRETFEITDQSTSLCECRTYLVNKKGILCELYADFGRSYVGGGLGVSVHSILEPLVAGSEAISCGPVHHRSTEFDLAQDLGRMSEVHDAAQFLKWLYTPVSKNLDDGKLEDMISGYKEFRKDILSC